MPSRLVRSCCGFLPLCRLTAEDGRARRPALAQELTGSSGVLTQPCGSGRRGSVQNTAPWSPESLLCPTPTPVSCTPLGTFLASGFSVMKCGWRQEQTSCGPRADICCAFSAASGAW